MAIKERIGYQVKRVSHGLRTHMDQTLRETGLTTPQYAALSAIEEAPGLSGNRLAQRCFVTAQTMNLLLVSLEKTGLILRQPHPDYKRTFQIYLTPHGKQILQESHPRVLAIEESMLAGLGRDKRLQLLDLLHCCAYALESHANERTSMP